MKRIQNTIKPQKVNNSNKKLYLHNFVVLKKQLAYILLVNTLVMHVHTHTKTHNPETKF